MRRKRSSKNSRAGRPTLLTLTLQRRLCEELAEGSTINAACAVCDISSRTYREWIDRGEQGEQPFAQIISAASRAREMGKHKLAKSILADRDWRARAWYLERCFPQEFGRVTPADEQSSPPALPRLVVINTRHVESPEVERLRAELPDSYEIKNLDGSVERIPIDDNAVQVDVEFQENEKTREIQRRFYGHGNQTPTLATHAKQGVR